MTGEPLLEVKNLDVSYGPVRVLYGLNFTIESGSVTTLLGANGAGKTTTLRAISGSVKRGGSIRLAGQEINRSAPEDVARLGVAHVPDGRGTFLRQTVEDNLHLGAMTRRDRKGILDDIELVYGYFPILKQRRLQPAGLLSGGEQQMLAVGRAMMLRPKLIASGRAVLWPRSAGHPGDFRHLPPTQPDGESQHAARGAERLAGA